MVFGLGDGMRTVNDEETNISCSYYGTIFKGKCLELIHNINKEILSMCKYVETP